MSKQTNSSAARLFFGFLLVAAVAGVFAPALRYDFANLDDPAYVTANPVVRAGIDRAGIAWAFTTFEQSNWHPLTWISLMIDAQAARWAAPPGDRSSPSARLDPRWFHGSNLLFHALNTLLLFLVLERLTERTGRSAAVAALFAVHPLHVESVVWVAERKDVLSTCFLLLALAGYAAYVRRPSAARYLGIAVPFALGLLAKPMLVTLPLLLLLLDFWPLGRLRPFSPRTPERWPVILGLVREKLPLLALSAASGVVTLLAQHSGGALRTLERYPLGLRLANAVVSYASYVVKTLWPAGLAVYYPHPREDLAAWLVVGSGLLCLLVTAGVLMAARSRPYLAVAWFWFAGTLVPVIGIVQVGGQARADRYTYVPLIGLFLGAVWWIADLAERRPGPSFAHRRALLAVATTAAVLALGAAARIQVGHWRSNTRLFEHALEVTSKNAMAHNCLGNAFFRAGRFEDSVAQYRRAIAISPGWADPHGNLGATLLNQKRIPEAEEALREALRRDPLQARPRLNLALILLEQRKLDEAAEQLQAALRSRPDLEEAWRYLGAVDAQLGRIDEAIAHLEEALRLEPADREAREWLEWARRTRRTRRN